MADDSPGKVQALRAIFSEKNNPVMGLMPPGAKLRARPWRPPSENGNALDQTSSALKEKNTNELKCGKRVLPVLEKSPSPLNTDSIKPSSVPKPTVGPKPAHLLAPQQLKMTEFECSNPDVSAQQRTVADTSRTKAFGETIASFIFASNKENENVSTPPVPPLPKPRISQLQNEPNSNKNPQNGHELDRQCCGVISSDNYICKVRRKELPPKEKLGPAPLKPVKPTHLKLPSNCCSSTATLSQSSLPVQRPQSLQRPSHPCPPRPVTSPPLPPISVPVIKPAETTLREEIEELYEDTLLRENKRPVSLIPEYTEEEEQAELYSDAAECPEENSDFSNCPLICKKPPPAIPSEYLQPNVNGSNEELYQDADGMTQEEFYEVMPCDEIEDSGSPLYSNNKREIEKLKKEEEKKIRKEQKEKEKREKELEKLKRKFALTGEEIPIDDGLVKWDSRGSKSGDLPVKRGETVLILRMEGNPSGRWLVKNEKGKIGYVELTNIEVDPLSVKSVMSIRRLSVISAGEELYCEAKSEEEAIYEVTY